MSEPLATALPAPQATRHAAAPTALRREDESAHFTRSPRSDTDLLSSWERSLVESASRSVASRERREPETTARTSAVGAAKAEAAERGETLTAKQLRELGQAAAHAASNTLFPSSAALIRRADEDPSFRSELLHKVSDGRAAAGHRHAPDRDVGGRDHRPGDLDYPAGCTQRAPAPRSRVSAFSRFA